MIFYDSRYEINRICIEVTRQALSIEAAVAFEIFQDKVVDRLWFMFEGFAEKESIEVVF